MTPRPTAASPAASPSAGVGLKPQHYADALTRAADGRDPGLWFEVHPENYMVPGGPRLKWLEAIRAEAPLSLHGVGLSLAGPERPDRTHLGRFRALIDRYEPFIVSEHLAWSRADGVYMPDLLPVPRTDATLTLMVDHVVEAQEALGRRLLIENPSAYLALDHEWDEVDFLTELARRSGCGLLVDVNNVFVSARNMGGDADAWVDRVPGDLVGEVHVAGHRPDPHLGDALLIDSHDAPVDAAVWALHARLMARIGARPTLLERDGEVPAFDALMAERDLAEAGLGGTALEIAA
ncbi:MAG: DUF692 domain-containing protein [Alphaproteobacteria bacterium]|nr:DUF692 domain-containing protein [Alphaproteobacteria bacterium]MBU1526137.1 DUF692 domain-containing protein [Alphaproteobacteria bacterium]MBU2116602.1 DUF692 domain-containing protein [Alphaproteobacteria bacterium]MBU2350226.1 DUF692 domain-containing protein [Alphaproteobacteria bacterium]MBU2381404.1 DUF692 domain-containing protein [Alphaproteobacteria bacterium]